MKIYCYDLKNTDSLTEDNLSPEAHERLMRYRSGEGYLRSLCAYNLVYRLFPDRELKFTEEGKPYIDDANIEIGISHSRDMVVVAVSEGKLGVDIEYIRDIDYTTLLKYAFTDKEKTMIHDVNDFFKLWTVKEAYAKYTGRGLRGYPIDIEVDEDYVLGEMYTSVILDGTYMLSVVGADVDTLEIIREN